MMQKPMTLVAGLPLSLTLAALMLSACAAPPARQAPATTPETVGTEPAPAPKPKITSQQLLGRAGPWVKAKLGEPAFVRAERNANIWQYKTGGCVLNVFLYADDDQTPDPAPRVLHFDARDSAGRNANRDTCLAVVQGD